MDKIKEEDKAKIEEEKKDPIAEGLGALKAAGKLNADNPPNEDTLASKMPSRIKNPKPDIHQKIEVPKSK